jgi:beta-lactamase class A/pimeloyl-ACP methyl ester carboxylesterase
MRPTYRLFALLIALLLLVPTSPAGATQADTATPVVTSAVIPATPVGAQLAWVLDQLNGRAATLTEADAEAHFAPAFLAQFPTAALVDLLRQTAAEHAPVTFAGFAGPPSATGAIALVVAKGGEQGAVYLDVEADPPHRITGLEFDEPPGPSARALAVPGPYTGAFDVGGGRKLFLTCAGTGSPTVVLEGGAGGGAAAWTAVQPAVAGFTRVCAYDRANLPGGASDPAPKPRTANDVVADLHALLTVARVPGPYVLVGHSDGGLFVRLYASAYPDEVAGLVLVDAVHEDQDARLREILERLLTPEQWAAYEQAQAEAAKAPFVAHVGDEQVDMTASFAQMRAARVEHPLRPMPLFVLTHGLAPDPQPGEPAGLTQAMEQTWRELQDDLAGLVPNARHVIAERSGHVIQQDQPGLVNEAIRQVVAAVRDPSTWGTNVAGAPTGTPLPPATPPPAATPAAFTSWDALDVRLRAQAPQTSFLAAEVVDGRCRPVHALDAGQRLAIASTMKLYILGELAHQIDEGRASWDEELAIRDDWKSPFSLMEAEPAGTVHTLRYYAEQMISVSDNTAADHLLFRLGRENVEAFQATMGHGDPARNVPFLATREMSALKLVLRPDQVATYLAAPVAEKRRLLATDVAAAAATMGPAAAAGWTAPRWVETVEWFASAEDLCRAMAALLVMSERPGLEPLREVLAINPGIPFDPNAWTYIGFKGGGEPGVANGTWLLRRADGRWFVLTSGHNDPKEPLDGDAGIPLMNDAAALLAATS